MAREASPNLQRLDHYLDRYQKRKASNKAAHVVIRVLVLALGASIPVLTTIDAASWITALVGAAIVVTTGVGQIFGPLERYIAFRIGYKALDCERMLFLAGAGSYQVADDEAERVLAKKLAEIIASTEASVVSSMEKPPNGGGGPPGNVPSEALRQGSG